MRYLTISDAAKLLGVEPSTVRDWERRFGFPAPERSAGNQRRFLFSEIEALERALPLSGSVPRAISRARAELAANDGSLLSALLAYDAARADRATELALGWWSLEHTVEEVLLPALDQIARSHSIDSSAWAFAARWGGDWLCRAKSLVVPPSRPRSILIGDASEGELDSDAPHIRALELFCVRAGIKTIYLSTRAIDGIGDLLSLHPPDHLVIAGGQGSDAQLSEWIACVERCTGPIPIAIFRHTTLRSPPRATRGALLPAAATAAQLQLLTLIEAGQERAIAPDSTQSRNGLHLGLDRALQTS